MLQTLIRTFTFTRAIFHNASPPILNLSAFADLIPTYGEHASSPIGVGFELSLDYATAAIAFSNGTTFPVERVDGSDAYVQAMSNFANNTLKLYPRDTPNYLDSCFPLPPPLNQDGIIDIGLMLRHLKGSVEEVLGTQVTAANVAIPFVTHLCRSDIDAAMSQAGLTYLYQGSGDENRTSLHSTSAVMVSNGMGVCADYTDIAACDAEESAIPESYTPHIQLTQKWLHITCPRTSKSYNHSFTLNWSEHLNIMILTGLDHRFDEADPDAEPEDPFWARPYWDRVYFEMWLSTIQSCRWQPSVLLLSGEGAEDPKFQTLLQLFAHDYGRYIDPFPPILQNNPLFAAAEGAAELAKRALWRELHS